MSKANSKMVPNAGKNHQNGKGEHRIKEGEDLRDLHLHAATLRKPAWEADMQQRRETVDRVMRLTADMLAERFPGSRFPGGSTDGHFPGHRVPSAVVLPATKTGHRVVILTRTGKRGKDYAGADGVTVGVLIPGGGWRIGPVVPVAAPDGSTASITADGWPSVWAKVRGEIERQIPALASGQGAIPKDRTEQALAGALALV